MAAIDIAFSHLGLWVRDMDRMRDFYSRIMGFAVTDQGLLGGTTPITFLSRDPREHHQIVLVQGRDGDAKVVNQISFRLPDLGAMKRFRERLRAEKLDGGLMPINHGNAWAIYFPDPEGNRIELFVDTDWYIDQPCREGLDLDRSESEIRADTEAFCKTQPGFKPMADWRAEIGAKIAAHVASVG